MVTVVVFISRMVLVADATVVESVARVAKNDMLLPKRMNTSLFPYWKDSAKL